jgi:tRNA1(Val) A37 N6-methylase TrmN6
MMIYPVERAAELISTMRDGGFEPKRLQCVHAYADSDAQLVLVRGRNGGQPGMTIAAPIVMYRRSGEYTEAFARLLAVQQAPVDGVAEG